MPYYPPYMCCSGVYIFQLILTCTASRKENDKPYAVTAFSRTADSAASVASAALSATGCAIGVTNTVVLRECRDQWKPTRPVVIAKIVWSLPMPTVPLVAGWYFVPR